MLEKRLVDNLYPGGWEASPQSEDSTIIYGLPFMACDSDNSYCDYQPIESEEEAVCGFTPFRIQQTKIVKDFGYFDRFNQATADNIKLITDEMEILACIRCPESTPVLSDLEREYGIVPNENIQESIRRFDLNVEKFKMESDGSVDTLTDAIQIAGFQNINAYENDPATDPSAIVGITDFMVCDSNNAYCDYQPLAGEDEAVCGILTSEGYVLANGTLYNIIPNIDSVCDEVYCDDELNNFCNHYINTTQDEIIYPITDDPNRWAHFIFVGGTVVRGGSGEILSITTIEVPLEDRDKLERAILKFKPIEKWAIMAIKYV